MNGFHFFSKAPGASGAVRIVVDDRERRSGVEEILTAMPEVTISRSRLTVGDYRVGDAILFERKTVSDFAQSMISGRLFTQASRLVHESSRVAFILEGSTREWIQVGLTREAIQGALIALSLVFGIPVLRSLNAEETARLLVYAGRQWRRAQSGGDENWSHLKAKRKSTRQRHLLQMLPGIGPERAKRLLLRFTTVRACFNASASELCEVDGIGTSTARAIVDTVN